MNERERHGRCLCGAIGLSLKPDSLHVGACHCSMCRKWGGGPLIAVESSTPPRISGEEHLRVYPSSDWAERGFCARCGSHLFYRLREGNHYAIPVGLFDDEQQWSLRQEVFIDEKPGFYAFANDTEQLTGAQLFAQFSAK